MIRSSYRVEACSTRHKIDLPKNKAFSNKPIHLGPYRSSLFPIQRSALCLYMKRCQRSFLLPKQILLHLYINAGLSRIRKKSTSNC
ncbi:hypothetical protein RJ641_012049 [Dillenia turbinata]|uniref:Uncharacterized protein n=1 Tax=Dillenia turbinata TaxID=194707 RepID=A0AAN8Z201_9MAGN